MGDSSLAQYFPGMSKALSSFPAPGKVSSTTLLPLILPPCGNAQTTLGLKGGTKAGWGQAVLHWPLAQNTKK